jgi:uncharacterized membrane protein
MRFNNSLTIFLFFLGLFLRLAGLPFNGMADLQQFIFNWGCGVRYLGLGEAFREIYGVFSYIFYALAAGLAELIPRFWWAPCKLLETLFEIAILFFLYRLLPRKHRYLALFMYWLNPYFVIHGAFYGYWEGPHLFFCLAGLLCLKEMPQKGVAWICAGALWAVSAMFKPQGFAYFVVPALIYLILGWLLFGGFDLARFFAGAMSVFGIITAFLMVIGGEFMAIPRNYFSVLTIMPNLSNESLNIWRPITRVLQAILGQSGPTYTLQLPTAVYFFTHLLVFSLLFILFVLFCLKRFSYQEQILSQEAENKTVAFIKVLAMAGFFFSLLGMALIANIHRYPQIRLYRIINRFLLECSLALITLFIFSLIGIAFCRRISDFIKKFIEKHALKSADVVLSDKYDSTVNIFLLFTFSSLVISQIGTMAHENHAYGGLVLLIPLAIANRRILISWATMIAINLYCPLAMYQLGRSTVLPLPFYLNYAPAQPLILKIKTALINQPNTALLQFQNNVNQFLIKHLPGEPVISVLSAIQFVCVIVIIREMFALATRSSSGIIFESTLKDNINP